jgi:metal-sulfur cluster biosynthetic enzyme
MSSSPQQRSTAGFSSNETIPGSYTNRRATLNPMVTPEDVEDALTNVIDPELGLDFVSLGLVYDVEIQDNDVYVTFTLTYPGCPIGPQVSEQIKEFVGELEGVEGVHPKMVFDPAWTPDMMSEDAKFALGF